MIYNLRVRILGCSALFLTVISSVAFSQTASPVSAAGTPNDTSAVSCAKGSTASRAIRSDTFISPDGKRRAYAQVTATPVPRQKNPEGTLPPCVNSSRLYVDRSGGEFDIVFLQEPTDTETGNGLRIVDWSSDDRRLLLELSQWQYETPGITRSPLIYQAEYGVFQQPDLPVIFHKQFGIDCSMEVHVGGFTAENQIVIETEPLSPEEEEVLSLPSCSRKKSSWILNSAAESIRPLPETSKVVHNAKTEPPAER